MSEQSISYSAYSIETFTVFSNHCTVTDCLFGESAMLLAIIAIKNWESFWSSSLGGDHVNSDQPRSHSGVTMEVKGVILLPEV